MANTPLNFIIAYFYKKINLQLYKQFTKLIKGGKPCILLQ